MGNRGSERPKYLPSCVPNDCRDVEWVSVSRLRHDLARSQRLAAWRRVNQMAQEMAALDERIRQADLQRLEIIGEQIRRDRERQDRLEQIEKAGQEFAAGTDDYITAVRQLANKVRRKRHLKALKKKA